MKSKDAFLKLFHWLDRDNDGWITQQDMLFGISKIMLKDASIKEVLIIITLLIIIINKIDKKSIQNL